MYSNFPNQCSNNNKVHTKQTATATTKQNKLIFHVKMSRFSGMGGPAQESWARLVVLTVSKVPQTPFSSEQKCRHSIWETLTGKGESTVSRSNNPPTHPFINCICWLGLWHHGEGSQWPLSSSSLGLTLLWRCDLAASKHEY